MPTITITQSRRKKNHFIAQEMFQQIQHKTEEFVFQLANAQIHTHKQSKCFYVNHKHIDTVSQMEKWRKLKYARINVLFSAHAHHSVYRNIHTVCLDSILTSFNPYTIRVSCTESARVYVCMCVCVRVDVQKLNIGIGVAYLWKIDILCTFCVYNVQSISLNSTESLKYCVYRSLSHHISIIILYQPYKFAKKIYKNSIIIRVNLVYIILSFISSSNSKEKKIRWLSEQPNSIRLHVGIERFYLLSTVHWHFAAHVRCSLLLLSIFVCC